MIRYDLCSITNSYDNDGDDDDDDDDDDGDDDGSVFITPLLRARAVCLWPKQTPAPSTFGPHL